MDELQSENYVIQRDHHSVWNPKKETILCECGEILLPKNYEKHEKSIQHVKHLNFIKGLNSDTKTINRIQKTRKVIYDNSKDETNCCCKCLNSFISDALFNKRYKVCRCCEEILKGGIKRCSGCKEKFELIEFERPYLVRCKTCAKNLKKVRAQKKLEDQNNKIVE
jgi:hypothetical protein